MNGLKILRQIDTQRMLPGVAEGLDSDLKLIQFTDGTAWVDNDQPWDAVTGHEIVKNTLGFIVTDAQYGRLYGPVRDLQKCEDARRRAKVEIVSIVDDIEEPAADAAAAEAAVA